MEVSTITGYAYPLTGENILEAYICTLVTDRVDAFWIPFPKTVLGA
jgi:hypothetical protein